MTFVTRLRASVSPLALSALLLPVLPAMALGDTVETVIVTAKRSSEDAPVVADARERLSRTPGAVAVVAAESYETRLVVGFSDLLRDVPGVLAQKRYGEESRLSIRGSGIDQSYHQRGVLLAQDGVPFADADGFSDFQKVDALGARYIEVYKGGNALRFGGAQLGGAINLITPTGRTAESENLLRLEGGSFGTIRGRAAVAREIGAWDFYIAGGAMQSDGFRVHSGLKQVRGTANIGYSFGEEQEIRLIITGADIKQDVPGAVSLATALSAPRTPNASVVANQWARDQAVGRVTLQSHWRLQDGLTFDGGVYVTMMDLHHPISIVIDQRSLNYGAFARLDWQGDVAGMAADMFMGISHRRGRVQGKLYNNVGGASGFQFGNNLQQATGTDIFAEGRLFVTDELAVVAGASYGIATRDYADYNNPPNNSDKQFDWLSPRFGLLWQNDSGVQVYANITRSVESPHYGALVQSPYPGFVPVEAQRAWTGEIGTRGTEGELTWDVTYFRSWIKGELLSFQASAGLPATFFNSDKTVHQGIEAALDWRIAEQILGGSLNLRQSYTWSDFRFDNDPIYGNGRLPVVPEHVWRMEAKYNFADSFFIAPSLEWRMSDVMVDYRNMMRAPSYAIFNLNAGWAISDSLSLFFDMRNLTDKKYAPEFAAITDASDPLTNKQVFYPGEGRSFSAGVTLRF